AFTDDGTNDTHTASIDWGDGNTTAGLVTETPGSGTVAGTHSYATAGNYTVTVTVTDDDGDPVSSSTTIRANSSPTANAGGPYTGTEGASIPLNGTAADPDNDPLTVTWTRSIVSAPPGTACTLSNSSSLTPTLSCNDSALVNVTISVSDN